LVLFPLVTSSPINTVLFFITLATSTFRGVLVVVVVAAVVVVVVVVVVAAAVVLEEWVVQTFFKEEGFDETGCIRIAMSRNAFPIPPLSLNTMSLAMTLAMHQHLRALLKCASDLRAVVGSSEKPLQPCKSSPLLTSKSSGLKEKSIPPPPTHFAAADATVQSSSNTSMAFRRRAPSLQWELVCFSPSQGGRSLFLKVPAARKREEEVDWLTSSSSCLHKAPAIANNARMVGSRMQASRPRVSPRRSRM